MNEEWRKIKGYENYEVSNFGRVKRVLISKERIKTQSLDKYGYFHVIIFKNSIGKTRTVHQLVAEAFLNHTPNGMSMVVDHIDFNRTNNNVNNLRIITSRENTNLKHKKSASQYVGVSWHKRSKKWQARIIINKIRYHLGYFFFELDASNAYQKALSNHLKTPS